jgi:ribosome-associated protein
MSFSRSRGPGGQSVNKVSTRCELRVAIDAIEGLNERSRRRLERLAGRRLTVEGEIVLHADRFRSQRRNREDGLDRLKELVLRAVREPRPRVPTRPTRASVERRLTEKRRKGEVKERRKRPPEE